jgi:hypothetical protein
MKDLDFHYKSMSSLSWLLDEDPILKKEDGEKTCTIKMKQIYDSLSKVLKDNKVIAEVGQPQEQRTIADQRNIPD